MRTLLALSMTLAIAGCADNAILELEVDLPPSPPGEEVYAFIQVRTDELGFDVPWSGADPVDGFLLSAGRTTQPISVVAAPRDYERNLRVRATFCSQPRCDGFGDDIAPERRLEIEHPFYSTRRTSATWRIEDVPADTVETPELIQRCEVAGCRDGTTREHCRRDGTHFCE